MWSWPGNNQILTCKGYTNSELQKVQGDMDRCNEKDIYFHILTKVFPTGEIMQEKH